MNLRFLPSLVALVAVIPAGVSAGEASGPLKVTVSWGHRSPPGTAFQVKLLADGVEMTPASGIGLEQGEGLGDGAWRTTAGGADVDGVQFALKYPQAAPRQIDKLNSIWADLVAKSDADTAGRLRADLATCLDARKLTLTTDAGGAKGFSVTVGQLLAQPAIYVPALDVYVAVGDAPLSFADHQRELERWRGQRVLDRVHVEPEATYAQYTARWEDMGSPRYVHPSQPEPGHIVCLSWDSTLAKFGVDRGAGVRSDLGNPDRFRFWFEFGDYAGDNAANWKGQRLADGLPIITTVIERDRVRYEVDQFAYPLDGPSDQRRGDLALVLVQAVRVTNLADQPRSLPVTVFHRRDLPARTVVALVPQPGGGVCLEEKASHRVLLGMESDVLRVGLRELPDGKAEAGRVAKLCALTVSLDLPAGGQRQFVVKLPSPTVAPSGRAALLRLNDAAARQETTKFWSDYLARGTRFEVPEKAVNDLFRANLWHALRLPRRHAGPGMKIDLPYSNFAYGQAGTPWPVNQAVYVDYMLYGLRGYPDLAAEELLAIYRNNQEPNGHVGGYASWVVNTPGMIYAVAENYLLSGDRTNFDRLLPQTLKAADWCLGELERAKRDAGPAQGLVRGPLNDLTGQGVWAFNQAYLYAGLDRLALALARAGHPRAVACRKAADELREAIVRGFGAATVRAPLVQLRDHTWTPYVPCEVLTPRRLLDQWYPTDVDTGALHLPRLGALASDSPLTDYLLEDHEDNLYLNGWGMANEPVYNQQATAYLLRDDPQAVIRAFYSMMACAFSHSVYEPVEHRWTWGQYFGPPSTDGAWFELYRRMLIGERDDGTLWLLQATPRPWLADGRRITIERAPTCFGPLSMAVESRAAQGRIIADIAVPERQALRALVVRLRHPEGKPLRAVAVNGQAWRDFDPARECVRIERPTGRVKIEADF